MTLIPKLGLSAVPLNTLDSVNIGRLFVAAYEYAGKIAHEKTVRFFTTGKLEDENDAGDND